MAAPGRLVAACRRGWDMHMELNIYIYDVTDEGVVIKSDGQANIRDFEGRCEMIRSRMYAISDYAHISDTEIREYVVGWEVYNAKIELVAIAAKVYPDLVSRQPIGYLITWDKCDAAADMIESIIATDPYSDAKIAEYASKADYILTQSMANGMVCDEAIPSTHLSEDKLTQIQHELWMSGRSGASRRDERRVARLHKTLLDADLQRVWDHPDIDLLFIPRGRASNFDVALFGDTMRWNYIGFSPVVYTVVCGFVPDALYMGAIGVRALGDLYILSCTDDRWSDDLVPASPYAIRRLIERDGLATGKRYLIFSMSGMGPAGPIRGHTLALLIDTIRHTWFLVDSSANNNMDLRVMFTSVLKPLNLIEETGDRHTRLYPRINVAGLTGYVSENGDCASYTPWLCYLIMRYGDHDINLQLLCEKIQAYRWDRTQLISARFTRAVFSHIRLFWGPNGNTVACIGQCDDPVALTWLDALPDATPTPIPVWPYSVDIFGDESSIEFRRSGPEAHVLLSSELARTGIQLPPIPAGITLYTCTRSFHSNPGYYIVYRQVIQFRFCVESDTGPNLAQRTTLQQRLEAKAEESIYISADHISADVGRGSEEEMLRGLIPVARLIKEILEVGDGAPATHPALHI